MPSFIKLTDIKGDVQDSAIETPFYLKLEGVDGDIVGSWGETTPGDIVIVKPLDATGHSINGIIVGAAANGHVKSFSGAADDVLIGGETSHAGWAIDGVVWGLDRVDQSAPATFFDGRFLRGVDLASGAGDSDGFDDIIVGTGVQGHVKSIDIDATQSRRDVNDMFVFQSPTSSTSPSFGGSGDDLLIGGQTSYDAIYKMHLIRHTTAAPAAADGNTYLGMTTVVDGGINVMLGDGSVRNVRSDTAGPFFAYDQGFLGGVTVPAENGVQGTWAVFWKGDRMGPLEQTIGGVSIAVADIEGQGPHMLMTAGFMF